MSGWELKRYLKTSVIQRFGWRDCNPKNEIDAPVYHCTWFCLSTWQDKHQLRKYMVNVKQERTRGLILKKEFRCDIVWSWPASAVHESIILAPSLAVPTWALIGHLGLPKCSLAHLFNELGQGLWHIWKFGSR